MRRDIRRRVFCPVISPAWRRRIGSGPLAAAVGRQREPLALVHEFRSGVVLDDLGAFDRCPATLRVGGCSNLWAAFGADRWAWFIGKKFAFF